MSRSDMDTSGEEDSPPPRNRTKSSSRKDEKKTELKERKRGGGDGSHGHTHAHRRHREMARDRGRDRDRERRHGHRKRRARSRSRSGTESRSRSPSRSKDRSRRRERRKHRRRSRTRSRSKDRRQRRKSESRSRSRERPSDRDSRRDREESTRGDVLKREQSAAEVGVGGRAGTGVAVGVAAVTAQPASNLEQRLQQVVVDVEDDGSSSPRPSHLSPPTPPPPPPSLSASDPSLPLQPAGPGVGFGTVSVPGAFAQGRTGAVVPLMSAPVLLPTNFCPGPGLSPSNQSGNTVALSNLAANPAPTPATLSEDIGAQVMAAAERLRKQLAEQGIVPAATAGSSGLQQGSLLGLPGVGGGGSTVSQAAAKLAEQQKKRAMLWKSKKADADKPDPKESVWAATSFEDRDGRATEKFRKLMGIKHVPAGTAPTDGPNLTEEQRKLFQNLDQQYELARMSTHTHRGVGLGFTSVAPACFSNAAPAPAPTASAPSASK